jgi:hypothetical protein
MLLKIVKTNYTKTVLGLSLVVFGRKKGGAAFPAITI